MKMKKKMNSLVCKLVIVFCLIFFVFFSLEVILPGLVSNVFNLNYVLLLVILGIGWLIGNSSGSVIEKNESEYLSDCLGWRGLFFFSAIIFLLLVFVSWLLFLKVPQFLSLVYFGCLGLVVYLFWRLRE